MRHLILIGMLGILMISLVHSDAVASNVYHTESEWRAIDTFWQNLHFSMPRNWEQMRAGLQNADYAIRNANIKEPQRNQLYPVTINIARLGSEIVTLSFSATRDYLELVFLYEPFKVSEEGFIKPYRQKLVYRFLRNGRSTPQRSVTVHRPTGKKDNDGSPLLVETQAQPSRLANNNDFREIADLLEKLALDHLQDRQWLMISSR